jgi:hypothetical protein
MNRKLMLLASGVLAALAFAALPALASAGEYEAHCEGAKECVGTITGGHAELRNDAGQSITCTITEGDTSFKTTSTTGTANLTFKECREQITFFHFKCNTPGLGAGHISVQGLVYHLVNLEPSPQTVPGIKFTNVNVTFECAGFANKTVTGSVVGEILNPASVCNQTVSTTSVKFAEASGATGTQKYMQITTSGTKTDLISNEDTSSSTYRTSAQIGEGIIHWTPSVKITC